MTELLPMSTKHCSVERDGHIVIAAQVDDAWKRFARLIGGEALASLLHHLVDGRMARAAVDGDRILTTRQAYPPPVIPEHLVVIGSGVTGVEFAHMFRAFGSKVSLVVSRQHVLPSKDPEVAAVLEESFVSRGVELHKGARAEAIKRIENAEFDGIEVQCADGRKVRGSHALLAIGSIPNSDGLGLAEAGITELLYTPAGPDLLREVRAFAQLLG